MSIKEYLTFTRRERFGIIALVIILLLVALLPEIIPKPEPGADTVAAARMAEKSFREMPLLADSGRADFSNARERYRRPAPWNHYSEENYRGGWGRQQYPGRDSFYYRRRFTHDQFYGSGDGRLKTNEGRKTFTPYVSQSARSYTPRYVVVEINTADTTAFIALPGIGSRLAARIVAFREKLGGFTSVDQIREVYGLRDSVFLRLEPLLKCDSAYAGRRNLEYTTFR